MVIHNDTKKAAQKWQAQVVDWILEAILAAAVAEPASLQDQFNVAFDDLAASVAMGAGLTPDRETAFDLFVKTLADDEVVREVVNSDKDVMALLDEKAELRLRTGFNIFVGGNILDRGITIPKLISFYYGRNPKTMQADTVLQHSRMYGNRSPQDLLVTRFFTSRLVYDRLETINSFENTLRTAFENEANGQGVVFLQSDAGNAIKPCAPNKVLLSDVVAVEPNGSLHPYDFQTIDGPAMREAQRKLDASIDPQWINSGEFSVIPRDQAFEILDLIAGTMKFEGAVFDWKAMKGLITYYLDVPDRPGRELLVIAETGRRLDRKASGKKSARSLLGTALRRSVLDHAHANPVLVLLQQEGEKAQNWKGYKFWWPILIAPGAVEPCVFATKTAA